MSFLHAIVLGISVGVVIGLLAILVIDVSSLGYIPRWFKDRT